MIEAFHSKQTPSQPLPGNPGLRWAMHPPTDGVFYSDVPPGKPVDHLRIGRDGVRLDGEAFPWIVAAEPIRVRNWERGHQATVIYLPVVLNGTATVDVGEGVEIHEEWPS